MFLTLDQKANKYVELFIYNDSFLPHCKHLCKNQRNVREFHRTKWNEKWIDLTILKVLRTSDISKLSLLESLADKLESFDNKNVLLYLEAANINQEYFPLDLIALNVTVIYIYNR